MEVELGKSNAGRLESNAPAPKPVPTEQAADVPTLFGIPMKYVSLVALTVHTCGQVIVIKAARVDSKEYINSTVILFAEISKMFFSVLLLGREKGSLKAALSEIKANSLEAGLGTFKLGVPALAYCVQNNCLFLSLEYLGAAVQQVTYQLKILTAALLSVTMLNKTVTQKQWISLILLVSGVVMVQVPENTVELLQTQGFSGLGGGSLIGFTAVLMACVVSGFAGVFMEKVLKGTSASIWLRNAQLAFFGSWMALLAVVVQDGSKVMEGGLTQGYTWGVLWIVWMLSSGGLLVAAVLKYADNILRQFSTALSIVLTASVSAMLFGESTLTLFFLLGTVITMMATFMYNGILDPALPEWLTA